MIRHINFYYIGDYGIIKFSEALQNGALPNLEEICFTDISHDGIRSLRDVLDQRSHVRVVVR